MNTCYRCDGALIVGDSHADKDICITRLQDQVAALKAVLAFHAKDIDKVTPPPVIWRLMGLKRREETSEGA